MSKSIYERLPRWYAYASVPFTGDFAADKLMILCCLSVLYGDDARVVVLSSAKEISDQFLDFANVADCITMSTQGTET